MTDSLSEPAPEPEPEVPGFLVRLGALLLDSLALATLHVILLVSGGGAGGSRLLDTLAFMLYHGVTVAAWGQSFGKMAAGIKVVAAATGDKPSAARAAGRALGAVVSVSLLMLGYLLALFNKKRRTLHDLLAGTRVVYVEPAPGRGRRAAIAVFGAFGLALPVLIGALQSLQFAGRAAQLSERKNLEALARMREAEGGGRPEELNLPQHPPSSEVELYGADVCDGPRVDSSRLRHTGHWGEVGQPGASCFGAFFIDCAHVDSGGVPWHDR